MDLCNASVGDEALINRISQSGENFNKQMAQYLTKSIISSKHLELVVECMKSLAQFHSQENRVLSDTFYQGYSYMQDSPLFKDKIPLIDIPPECLKKFDNYPSLRLLRSAQESFRLSEEISSITKKINRLEVEKRQPLELFELMKKYEELKKQYDKLCDEQATSLMS